MAEFKILMIWAMLLANSQDALSACSHDVLAELGQTVMFSATTVPGNDLRWYKNNRDHIIFTGRVVMPDYRKRFSALVHGNGTVDLVIQNVSFADAGSYGYVDEFTNFEGKLQLVVVDSSTLKLKRLEFKNNRVQYEVALNYAADTIPTVVFFVKQNDGSTVLQPPVHTTAMDNSIKSLVTVDRSPTPDIVTSIHCQILFNLSYPSCLQPADIKSSLHVHLEEQFSTDIDGLSSIHTAYISAVLALIPLNVFFLAFCVVYQTRKRNRKLNSSKPEADYGQLKLPISDQHLYEVVHVAQ